MKRQKSIENLRLFLFLLLVFVLIIPLLVIVLKENDQRASNQGIPEGGEAPTVVEEARERIIIPNTGMPSISPEVDDVERWKQYRISFTNNSWDGNPFDIPFEAMFTHVSSGRTIRQLGFYAGDNTWKIFFMPDVTGDWTYTTRSSDPDLDGKMGSFHCISSPLPGPLVGDGNRWRYKDSGEYISPIMIPTRQFFKSKETNDGVDDFIKWADETAGAQLIGTTLVYFNQPQTAVPYIKGEEGELFNFAMWDRLNSHLDMLRDRGMGFYVMFYSDDRESPNLHNIRARSQEEERLFRYAVARLSAYPVILWDTGIDISETRSNDWIDWFTDWFNEHDPWRHPVSSRTGGGSGGKIPNTATYFSDGTATLPDYLTKVNDWSSRSVPTIYTDRWRENYGRGNFDPDKIRQAAWEVGLVGGMGVYVGGDENEGYLTESYASDFKAAPYLGLRNRFFRNRIRYFGGLVPMNQLVEGGKNITLAAQPGFEYVAYDGDGGSIELDLSGVAGDFQVEWYNPRNGDLIAGGFVEGGRKQAFQSPGDQDWVLHLTRSGASLPRLFNNLVFLPAVLIR